MQHFPSIPVPFVLIHSPSSLLQATALTRPYPLPMAPFWSVLFVSEGTNTLSPLCSVQPDKPGMTSATPSLNISTKPGKSKIQGLSSTACGSMTVAAMRSMTTCMCAQAVKPSLMEPALVLKHRRLQPLTPYRADTWESAL